MSSCCFSAVQSPIQAVLRPAVWLPGVRNLHSYKETWEIDQTPEVCLEKLLDAISEMEQSDDKIYVRKVNREKSFVQIFNYTEAEWLDIVEIEFKPGREKGSVGKAHSFSSGLLPACVPLCFIWNMIFFFIPFYDRGLNKDRLERIRVHLQLPVVLLDKEL